MSTSDERIAALRAFNRFYTRRIGVLHEGLLDTRFSLTESRLLWELAHREHTTATDGRQTRLSISAAGRRAFAPLERRSQAEVAALLDTLSDAQQQELLAAMTRIETLLGAPAKAGAFVLRAHRPGDIGWVVSRHGALYAQEYGWDLSFEALVAQIAAGFIERFDPAREACWIAEREGQRIGCVFLVQARDEATQAVEPGSAQLRMLLVEPSARGLGLGVALVNQCERFARQVGDQRIRLWTNSVLLAARGIYERAGFQLRTSEPHHSFGHDLVGETWELSLK